MKSFLTLVFFIFLFSCGIPSTEVVGSTSQALANPQDTLIQPYTCESTYDPFCDLWPIHGYCQWLPAPGKVPTAVGSCIGIPTIGQVDLYSGLNYTGMCARILIVSQWDFEHVAHNGWNTVRTVHGAVSRTNIRSFEIGSTATTATLFLFSQDPNIDGPTQNSAYCAGHTGSQAEHKQYCGVSHLGIYTPLWNDSSQIASFSTQ